MIVKQINANDALMDMNLIQMENVRKKQYLIQNLYFMDLINIHHMEKNLVLILKV